MNPLDNFTFVMVRPIRAGNIGASARALKNMGVADLRLVAPEAKDDVAELAMAVHARDLLQSARVFDDLPSALADCTLTVGSTCRPGPYRDSITAVRAAAPDLIAASSSNRIAILFGPEDTGLSNEDLKLCHRLVTIPTAPDYPSLNLAQAVIVIAYELMLAAGAARPLPAADPFASAAEVEAMMTRLSGALSTIGFLSDENSDHMMLAIRGLFGRGGLHPRELDILNGIARQIRWFATGGREVAAAKLEAGRKLR